MPWESVMQKQRENLGNILDRLLRANKLMPRVLKGVHYFDFCKDQHREPFIIDKIDSSKSIEEASEEVKGSSQKSGEKAVEEKQ